MKITKEFGNTIHGDNTISKTTVYHFDNLFELKEYWQKNKTIEGTWIAHLERLTIEQTQWATSEEYFAMLETIALEEE